MIDGVRLAYMFDEPGKVVAASILFNKHNTVNLGDLPGKDFVALCDLIAERVIYYHSHATRSPS